MEILEEELRPLLVRRGTEFGPIKSTKQVMYSLHNQVFKILSLIKYVFNCMVFYILHKQNVIYN